MKKSLPAIAILAAFLVLCLGLDSLRAQGEYITSNPNPPRPSPRR